MSEFINPEEPQWAVTQGFATRPGGYNPAGGHTGRDKGMPVGRPLRAPADGVITLAGNAGAWNTNPYWLNGPFAGLSVVLDAGAGKPAFTLNHCSKILVTKGQRVRKGDIIAISGNTGQATTGPHHHFEVMPDKWNFQNGTYGRINPDTVCKGFWDGSQGEPTVPNQRKNGPQVTNQRAEPNVSAAIVREIPPNQLEVFEGFVYGQKVTSKGFTSDVWYKDKIGYSWCGAFTSQATVGLPDLTPRKTLAANQRLTGPAGAVQRSAANRSGAVVRQIPGSSVEVFTGFVRGERVTSGAFSSDIWYVDAKGFVWSGGFETQDTVGLPDLTVVPAPVAPPEPEPVPAPVPAGHFLNGIDVAVYQEAAALQTLGADFIAIKASEGGAGWADKALASNVAEARLTGKPVGFYHFARPLVTAENTAVAEAESFLQVIRPFMQPGDFLALDWEAENQDRTDWALEWLELVQDRTGAKPFIYLNAKGINGGDWSAVETNFPLWYAGYGNDAQIDGFRAPAEKPDVTWGYGVLMWQYSQHGRLPGYGADLDFNVFYGTAGALQALGVKAPAVPAPAPNPPIVAPAPPSTDAAVLMRFFTWLVELFVKSGK